MIELLACPRDRERLVESDGRLRCSAHAYEIVAGIPVLLGGEPTHVTGARGPDEGAADVDPVVADVIVDTCGNLYRHLRGRLPRYPIPDLRLPPGDGRLLLDVGCSWGRWTIASARRGYTPVGIDPSVRALRAASRVSAELGVSATFVAADARMLPFRDAAFDVVFSYSVLQHFAKDDVRRALAEIRRVLKPGGLSFVQMANARGLRNTYRRLRARRPRGFDVRYWSPRELLTAFADEIGPSTLAADGFFSLNAQTSDVDLMPPRYRLAIRVSDALRAASERARPLALVADSLYVRSVRA